jgi:hypothetical protein
MLAGLPADPLPPILGVVPSRARPGAAVLLAAGEAGTPLLTVWNVGLGRVACWSSSADAAWIGPWLEHEKFPAFVAQWVTDCLPPALEPGCLADHDGFQTRVHLVKPLADASAGVPRLLLAAERQVAATLADPWTLISQAADPMAVATVEGPVPIAGFTSALRTSPRAPHLEQLEQLAGMAGGQIIDASGLQRLVRGSRVVTRSALSWLAAATMLLVVLAYWLERREMAIRR